MGGKVWSSEELDTLELLAGDVPWPALPEFIGTPSASMATPVALVRLYAVSATTSVCSGLP
jgi:hypothetical protein